MSEVQFIAEYDMFAVLYYGHVNVWKMNYATKLLAPNHVVELALRDVPGTITDICFRDQHLATIYRVGDTTSLHIWERDSRGYYITVPLPPGIVRIQCANVYLTYHGYCIVDSNCHVWFWRFRDVLLHDVLPTHRVKFVPQASAGSRLFLVSYDAQDQLQLSCLSIYPHQLDVVWVDSLQKNVCNIVQTMRYVYVHFEDSSVVRWDVNTKQRDNTWSLNNVQTIVGGAFHIAARMLAHTEAIVVYPDNGGSRASLTLGLEGRLCAAGLNVTYGVRQGKIIYEVDTSMGEQLLPPYIPEDSLTHQPVATVVPVSPVSPVPNSRDIVGLGTRSGVYWEYQGHTWVVTPYHSETEHILNSLLSRTSHGTEVLTGIFPLEKHVEDVESVVVYKLNVPNMTSGDWVTLSAWIHAHSLKEEKGNFVDQHANERMRIIKQVVEYMAYVHRCGCVAGSIHIDDIYVNLQTQQICWGNIQFTQLPWQREGAPVRGYDTSIYAPEHRSGVVTTVSAQSDYYLIGYIVFWILTTWTPYQFTDSIEDDSNSKLRDSGTWLYADETITGYTEPALTTLNMKKKYVTSMEEELYALFIRLFAKQHNEDSRADIQVWREVISHMQR